MNQWLGAESTLPVTLQTPLRDDAVIPPVYDDSLIVKDRLWSINMDAYFLIALLKIKLKCIM